MIIGFWSSVSGQSGTTSNLLATATLLASSGRKSVIVEGKYKNLIKPAIYGFNRRNDTVFEDMGIDTLLRIVKSGSINDKDVEACSISLLNRRFNYIPETDKVREDLFIKDFLENCGVILRNLERIYGIVFVDLQPGNSKLTKIILEQCNYIIVNVNQNLFTIDDLIKNYDLPWKNVLFICGNFDNRSIITQQFLVKRYAPFITRDNLFVIPYNFKFHDSVMNSDVLRFFIKYTISKKTKADDVFFIESVHRIANKVIELDDLFEEESEEFLSGAALDKSSI